MNLSLNEHEAECTPLMPCRSCEAVRFLKEHFRTNDFERLRALFIESGFDPAAHNEGCSPIAPCSNCILVEQLRNTTGKDRVTGEAFVESFLALYTCTSPAPNVPTELRDVLMLEIASFDLSIRTSTCLKNDKVLRVGDLVQKTEAELIRTPNFGRKSLNEIKEVLISMDLTLGMDIPGWPPQ